MLVWFGMGETRVKGWGAVWFGMGETRVKGWGAGLVWDGRDSGERMGCWFGLGWERLG